MRQILKGSTDVSVDVYIIDSTNGTPETGVLFNAAGMDLKYRREGAAVVSITEATLEALTTAHTDGGFLEIGNGLYRLDVPDAAFAIGAETVAIFGTVTGMIVLPQTIQLVDFNPEDGVRLGLTALPNAAAEAAGGLYTRGTGAGQINQPANGRIDAEVEAYDSALDFNATQKASVNAEVDSALDTAIPASPTANSINERVRDVDDALVIRRGTAQAGTANTITLDFAAGGAEDIYNGLLIAIVAGTGAQQARFITDWDNTDKIATVNRNWVTNPDATSVFILLHADLLAILSDGTAFAGANIDAAISSRAPEAGGNVASIKTKTDQLTFTNANKVDAAIVAAADFAQAAADKVWSSATRTLTGFSTALAVSVWDVLETAIATASSIGLKVKNNLDAAISSRSSHSAADVWTAVTRTLTAGPKDAEIDAIKAKTDLLPSGVPKNVALSNFSFLMVDSTDHVTPKIGLTITAQISKDGAAFAATTNAAVEVGNGIYAISLTAAEMNADVITLRFAATGADDRLITVLTST